MGNKASQKKEVCEPCEDAKEQKAETGASKVNPVAPTRQEASGWIRKTRSPTMNTRSPQDTQPVAQIKAQTGAVSQGMDGAQVPAKMLQERKPKFFWAQEVQSLPKGTGETRAQLAVQPMQCKPHAIRQTMQEAKVYRTGIKEGAGKTQPAGAWTQAGQPETILETAEPSSACSKDLARETEHTPQSGSQTPQKKFSAVCKRHSTRLLRPSPVCRWFKRVRSRSMQ